MSYSLVVETRGSFRFGFSFFARLLPGERGAPPAGGSSCLLVSRFAMTAGGDTPHLDPLKHEGLSNGDCLVPLFLIRH